MGRVMWAAWYGVLLWFVWLFGSAVGAEGATWRDVLTARSIYEAAHASCVTWIQETGGTSYKLWGRCTNGGNGTKSTVAMYRLPSSYVAPSDKPLHYPQPTILSCNFTGQGIVAAAGMSYFGGGHYQDGGTEYVMVTGSGTSASVTIDCFGAMSEIGAPSSIGNIGSSSICPISTTDSGRNCVAMDTLVQDFGTVTDDGCGVTSSGGGQIVMGVSNKMEVVHSCNCIPRRYGETQLVNAQSNTCSSVRVTGDPSVPIGKPGRTDGGGPASGDPTTGMLRVDGEPGTGGSGGGGTVPTVPPGGGGDGTTVPVSGTGPGGSVVVSGTGTGGTVKVEGTGAGGAIKTTTKADLDTEAQNTTLPEVPGAGSFTGEVDSIKPEEKDWPALVTDFLANSVPLISAIRGSGVATSGEVCRIEATVFGATVPFDFCPFEAVLQAFGVFVVGISCLYSLMIIAGRA